MTTTLRPERRRTTRWFDPGPLDGSPKQCVEAIDNAIAQATQWRDILTSLRSSIEQELAPLTQAAQHTVQSPTDNYQRDDLAQAVRHIDDGVSGNFGVLPRLASIVGKPGLEATVNKLEDLQKLREVHHALLTLNPDAIGRYRLKPGVKHIVGTRIYRGGDVIELSSRQYNAFGDKFDPVGPDTPLTKGQFFMADNDPAKAEQQVRSRRS